MHLQNGVLENPVEMDTGSQGGVLGKPTSSYNPAPESLPQASQRYAGSSKEPFVKHGEAPT